jgi:hypothetical protein
MIHIGESKYPQLATVWEVESKGSYALVKLGTSRKDAKTKEYVNSNWSFVRFVGSAAEHIGDVEKGKRIVIVSGGISLEPYMKDNVKTWPKSPQIVVFAWDYPDGEGPVSSNHEDEEDSENIPF